MEAALRTAAYVLTGENPDPDAFADVRTGPDLREVTYEIAGIPVRCAVVSGLGSARELVEQLKAGKAHYDFVEVMACPGGCVGGGGQPISVEDEERYGVRGERLYAMTVGQLRDQVAQTLDWYQMQLSTQESLRIAKASRRVEQFFDQAEAYIGVGDLPPLELDPLEEDGEEQA